MRNIISILVTIFILSGCATRGLWEPDNNTGYVMDSVNAKTIDVKYNLRLNDDSIICTYIASGIMVSLAGNRPNALSNNPIVTEIIQWDSRAEGKTWSVQLGESDKFRSLIYLKPILVSDSNREFNYSCKYTYIDEVYVGKFKGEKIVGRIILTPFAVATDVVIVATAVIWYPVMALMFKDMKNVN